MVKTMCTFLADDNWVNHTEIFMGHTQVHDKYTFGFMLPALFYRADGHNRRFSVLHEHVEMVTLRGERKKERKIY